MKTIKQKIYTHLFLSIILLTGLSIQSVYGQSQWETFGEEITESGSLKASEALSQFSKEGSKVKIEGEIAAVCDKVGWWAQLVIDKNQSIRIKFKDYGFFIPVKAAGRRIIAEGMAYRKPVSDGNENVETTTEYEYEVIADGVLLSK